MGAGLSGVAMKSALKFGVPVVVMLIGGSAYAAVQSWRPVMPEFVVDVRTADGADKTPSLMLIYGEHGSDPFHAGNLGADRRISGCRTVGSLCVSRAARNEFGAVIERPQSLQVRLSTKGGNPIVGGVSWSGSWHPRQVRVTCDLRVTDVRKSCAVLEITA